MAETNVLTPLAIEATPLNAVTIPDMIEATPLKADIAAAAILNATRALTNLSMASATSSGSTVSIHFPNLSRNSANSSPLMKSFNAVVTRSIKIIKPSPTVSMNGSRCFHNSASLLLRPSQSTSSLNLVNTSISLGNPDSITHLVNLRTTSL